MMPNKGPGLRQLALAASAMFSACQMMAFVLYPYFAEATGLSLATVVGSFSVGSLLFLWGAPYWARRSASLGPRPVLALGLLGLLVSQGMLLVLLLGGPHWAAVTSVLVLGLSRVIYGLTAAAIVPVAQTILAASSGPKARLRAMTRHSIALHGGRLLGPLIVWVGLLLSATAPLWMGVALLGGLTVQVAKKARGSQDVPMGDEHGAGSQDILVGDERGKVSPEQPDSWQRPASMQSWLLLLLAFLLTALVGLMQSSITHRLQQQLQLSAHEAAQMTLQFLILASLATILVQGLMQAVVKNPWQGTIPLGSLCLVLSCFVLARFQSQSELWWSLPLFASGVALVTPSYTTALSLRENSSRQGAVAGALSVTHTLGYATGGLLAATCLAVGSLPLNLASYLSLVLLFVAITVKAGSEQQFKIMTRDHS